MKKIILCILISSLVLCFVSCGKSSSNTEMLQQKYPEYFNLSCFKGLEVYIWETSEDTYRCGILSGTNRTKTTEELQKLIDNGVTVEEMKLVLKSYNIPDELISIIPISSTLEYDYDITDDDFQKIKALFK